jgi:hypothetical protein
MVAEMVVEICQDGVEQRRAAAGVSLNRRADPLLSEVMVPHPRLGDTIRRFSSRYQRSSRTLGKFSDAIPQPVSAIEISTASPLRLARTVRLPPWGLASRALVSRLRSTTSREGEHSAKDATTHLERLLNLLEIFRADRWVQLPPSDIVLHLLDQWDD